MGVAFNTYILLELDTDIYILDQHAAHERVLYEKVKKNFYNEGGKESQMLLLPDVLELSKKDMRTIKDHMDLFISSRIYVRRVWRYCNKNNWSTSYML